MIYQGDSLEILAAFVDDNSIDAIVCDPPYGLNFMGKKWDYDVPSSKLWAECLRVLKPGGLLLAFAGTRTQHRMAVNIEDAGFEIRDMIAWIYGSGFPKSKNLGDGFGSALKPAMEPLTVARKPLTGTLESNWQKWGVGGLNIDGCRVPHVTVDGGSLATNPHLRRHINGGNGGHVFPTESDRRVVTPNADGRFPANLIHDGSDEVVALFPDSNGAGGSVPNVKVTGYGDGIGSGKSEYRGGERIKVASGSGSAARFFYCAKASRADRNEGCEGMQKKLGPEAGGVRTLEAGKSGGYGAPRENHHPTVKPTDLMRYLCRLVTPPAGVVLDPFAGSGSTGKAAILEGFKFIGIEREPEYVEIARARIAAARKKKFLTCNLAEAKLTLRTDKQENKVELPKWAKWIATDADGEVYVYEDEPYQRNRVWNTTGLVQLVADGDPDPNWKDSLRPVGDTPATARDEGAEHYTEMDIQPWDVIDTWPREQQIGFYRGNLLKYTMRMGSKDLDQQEIKKAEHYARKLQEVLAK